MLVAMSCGIDGSSLYLNLISLNIFNFISGTVLNETFSSPSFRSVFSRPMNDFSMTLRSRLWERSSIANFGRVAKTASSILSRWLLETSKNLRDYKYVCLRSWLNFKYYLHGTCSRDPFHEWLLWSCGTCGVHTWKVLRGLTLMTLVFSVGCCVISRFCGVSDCCYVLLLWTKESNYQRKLLSKEHKSKLIKLS